MSSTGSMTSSSVKQWTYQNINVLLLGCPCSSREKEIYNREVVLESLAVYWRLEEDATTELSFL